MKFISTILASLGLGAANFGSQACFIFFWDEDRMPKSLIK